MRISIKSESAAEGFLANNLSHLLTGQEEVEIYVNGSFYASFPGHVVPELAKYQQNDFIGVSKHFNAAQYPVLSRQEIGKLLEEDEASGRPAGIVSFLDAAAFDANSLCPKMSGLTPQEFRRLQSVYEYHFPEAYDRYACAVLGSTGKWVQASYVSRKISTLEPSRFEVEALAFRLAGNGNEVLRYVRVLKEPEILT